MNQALPRTILIDEVSAPHAPPPERDEGGFGFQDLMSMLLSQRLFMLAVLLIAVAAGAAFAYTRPKSYSAVALIALGAGQTPNVSQTNAGGNPQPPDNALVLSEMEILRSNDLLSRLVAKLQPETVAAALGLHNPHEFANAAADSDKMRSLIETLRSHEAVDRQQTSNVLAVSFGAASPQAAVTLSNGLVDAYLDSKLDERDDASKRASDWLNRRVEQLAKDVDKKEAAVAAYRAEMKLISVDGATLTEQQYFKLQGEVVAARADLASKQARLAQVQQIAASGGNDQSVLEAVNSPTIQALRQKEAEIAGREAELRQRYFANHPSVQQVVREHEEVLQQIAAETSRIKSSLGNEVDVARSRLNELETGLRQLEGNLVEGNRAIVRLKELERDAEASSAVYRDFRQRALEIAEQESLKVVDARAVSRAVPPLRASSTSPTLWLAFFVAGGVLLAVVGALVRSSISDRIVRPESVSPRIGAPTMVSIPLISQRQLRKLPPDERTPEDFLVNKPMTAFAESLRVLATNLMSDVDKGSLAVAVTSAVAAEGKTTVSLSLARAAAMSGLRVLVLDCDARRPSLSSVVAETPAYSLADVVKGKIGWRDAAVMDPLTSALVLPISARTGDLQSIFRPEPVRNLLSQVRDEFDLIVMDCPPVLAVAETRWLAMVADATIVVARWNHTRTSAVRTAVREIMRAKGRVAGVVLNRMDVGMTKRFSFSDSLYYGNAGRGYYTN